MVPGVRGELLMSAFLERHLADHPVADPAFAAWVRRLDQLRRQARAALGPASSHRAVLDVGGRPLVEHLGFTLGSLSSHRWGHAGVLSTSEGAAAAYLGLAWGQSLDGVWREAIRAGLTDQASWLVAFNGRMLTIVDAARTWNRRALEIDLDVACRDPRAAQALWALGRADALRARGGTSRLTGLARASDADGIDVCSSLGRGVLDALQTLVAALDPPGPARRRASGAAADIFEQALTIVYRVLFLLFAEARGLVPTWHDVYRESYGLDALCQRVLRQRDAAGTWDTLRAISRLAHRGCRTSDLAVTAFNGRLFSPRHTPLGESRRVPDAHAARALLALATASTRRGRHRIRFHDLGVEQLGAVYERVLEYAPARRGGTLTLEPTSTERKTSGSFYTPLALTDFLVRRTLAPLVDGRSAASILELRIVDPAMGSGAFLVSACRYLARRLEAAHIAEGTWVTGEVTDRDRAEARRLVAERCLYGVDANPTAVQLARLSLWLTTLAAERPLTFLDHHLSTGNSLIGIRIADLAHPPHAARRRRQERADQAPLFDRLAAEELGRDVLPERLRLALERSDTADVVRDKERRLGRLEAAGGVLGRWLRAADLRCGLQLDTPVGLTGGLYAELQDHAAARPTTLGAQHLSALADEAIARARDCGAFHWDLAFPEVFLDPGAPGAALGGFDAVVGNPPWEMMKADTGGADDREEARAASQTLLAFVRRSGHYPLQRGGGHLNAYQLFVERALQILRPGGRFGLILPSGLASDVGSADLRRGLLGGCTIDTWYGFENRLAIFPIHCSMRFLVVAATRGGATAALPLVNGLRDASSLDRLPDEPAADACQGAIVLPRPLLERWDALHLTVPNLVSAIDLAIVAKALSIPSLGSEAGWHVRFGRELNATDDRGHFHLATGHPRDGRRWLPVVEGKHLRPFAIDVSSVTRSIDREVARTLVDPAVTYRRARVAYRDVASATNRLTLMAARLPSGAISTHTLYCAKHAMPEDDQWCLVGLLNSLTANYLVRLQMSTHVTTALMARLPVPRPAPGSAACRILIDLSRRLAAKQIDGDPDAYARLNAVVSGLYGLTTSEHRHVVSTFPLLSADIRARSVERYAGQYSEERKASPTGQEP
jgi:hypothetical protein